MLICEFASIYVYLIKRYYKKMKEIIFIAVYFYLVGFAIFKDKEHKKIFGVIIVVGIAVVIIGMAITKFISYASGNTSTVRDIAVIIACICVVIASITTVIMLTKKK